MIRSKQSSQSAATTRAAAIALGLLALLVLSTHLGAIYTEAINWDEFGLFYRVRRTADTGIMHSGGRPGLAVLVLLPMVSGCLDVIATARTARLVWAGITLAYVSGFFFLLHRFLRRSATSPWGAAAGTGLLVLVPNWLQWSVQVRTDQMTLAFGLWGGAVLLVSRGRPHLASVAGVLMAMGYLSTQKGIYVAALGLLLAAGELFRDWELNWRREITRLLGLVLGAGVTIALYRLIVPMIFDLPTPHAVSSQLNVFDWYRQGLGYRVYHAMRATVVPHFVLAALFVVATGIALVRRGDDRRTIAVGWAVMAVGGVVGWFHAAAFPYFWMTLGIFPAAALAIAWQSVLGVFPGERVRSVFAVAVWVGLLATSAPATRAILRDTQAIQRESFAFIDRNFRPEDRGYQIEGALFCRTDPDPFPAWFTQHIVRQFGEPGRPSEINSWISDFRAKHVKFVVTSYRLDQFPRPIRKFWQDHYVLYRHAVLVPGRTIRGNLDETVELDLIVGGTYRWLPMKGDPSMSLRIDGREVSGGSTVELKAGAHQAQILGGNGAGMLVWKVSDAPAPIRHSFYSIRQIRGIGGKD